MYKDLKVIEDLLLSTNVMEDMDIKSAGTKFMNLGQSVSNKKKGEGAAMTSVHTSRNVHFMEVRVKEQ